MFSYVDLYMQHRPRGLRYVILNVYGGESLHHPQILDILHAVKDKYKQYQDRWHLTITTTTNGIVKPQKMKQIAGYIDEFTMSYHTENSNRQKDLFKSNSLMLTGLGKRVKCVVLMHNDESKFNDAKDMIDWLETNQIRYLPRQLDEGHRPDPSRAMQPAFFKRVYTEQQVRWFDGYYKSKTFNTDFNVLTDLKDTKLSTIGRACCGGRQVCTNSNFKNRQFYINNRFTDWYCSVNRFFLYVKQINGEIFVNRDCKMNFDGKVGAIGHLDHSHQLLDQLTRQLKNNALPVIRCAKQLCLCGLCAPKALDFDTYTKIIKKYVT